MYLMLKDTPVLQFNITTGEYNELRPDLLPFRMRGAFKYNGTDFQNMVANHDVMVDYLSSRVLDLDRKNAKKLLNAYHFTQSQSPIDKAKIAITCRTVSMTDCYWIKDENEQFRWRDMDPKHNSLSDIVQHIALSGSSLTINGIPHSPELTGHGAYAKAWIREEDDNYLYKKGTEHGMESDIEISVSKILDHFNVPHVVYESAFFDGEPMSKCKNMATDQLDLLTAEDYYRYCCRNEKHFLEESLQIDAENIYKTCIVDYLISNPDRHMQNWGFYIHNESGKPVLCHPLFDHNNAFDSNVMQQIEGAENQIFQTISQREAAVLSLGKCNFHCIKPLSKDLFLSEEMYESFMQRADVLGLYHYVKPSFSQKIHLQTYEPFVPTRIIESDTQIYERELQQKCVDIEHSKVIESNRSEIQNMDLFDALEKSIDAGEELQQLHDKAELEQNMPAFEENTYDGPEL